MVDKRTWDEFREAGMLWLINGILNVFGWAICCVDVGGGDAETFAFPARVKFRGFDAEENDNGYRNIAKYMKENAASICEDTTCEKRWLDEYSVNTTVPRGSSSGEIAQRVIDLINRQLGDAGEESK